MTTSTGQNTKNDRVTQILKKENIFDEIRRAIEGGIPDLVVFETQKGAPDDKIGFASKKSNNRWWLMRVLKYMFTPDVCDFSLINLGDETQLVVEVYNQKYAETLGMIFKSYVKTVNAAFRSIDVSLPSQETLKPIILVIKSEK